MFENLVCEIDYGKYLSGVLIHISKAFDCVNTKSLLDKIFRLGIHGVANKSVLFDKDFNMSI